MEACPEYAALRSFRRGNLPAGLPAGSLIRRWHHARLTGLSRSALDTKPPQARSP